MTDDCPPFERAPRVVLHGAAVVAVLLLLYVGSFLLLMLDCVVFETQYSIRGLESVGFSPQQIDRALSFVYAPLMWFCEAAGIFQF